MGSEALCAKANAARPFGRVAFRRERFQLILRPRTFAARFRSVVSPDPYGKGYCGGAGGCMPAGMPRGGLFAATRSSDRLVRSVAIASSVLAGFNCSRANALYT